VVTTSLDVAVPLSRVHSVSVYNIGGLVEPSQHSQLGDWALTELARFRVDLAVLPAAGLTVTDGLFATTPMTAAVATAELAAAQRVWLLVEADRIGVPSVVRVAPIDRIDRIYTPGPADPARLQPFRDAGVEVTDIVVTTSGRAD
jgi:DeoR family fructose operon transcriptional repressor